MTSGHVLDICFGNGGVSVNMAKSGFNVTGVDISKPFIEDAKKKAEKSSVTSLTCL